MINDLIRRGFFTAGFGLFFLSLAVMGRAGNDLLNHQLVVGEFVFLAFAFLGVASFGLWLAHRSYFGGGDGTDVDRR